MHLKIDEYSGIHKLQRAGGEERSVWAENTVKERQHEGDAMGTEP